jgi:methylmalonyl-CoA/ethylmalonyl-CoA epimerase
VALNRQKSRPGATTSAAEVILEPGWPDTAASEHDRTMSEAVDLDHVALAAERLDDLWPRYATELGGRWYEGGRSPGFDWAQVAFANAMRIEGLQPARVEEFDFLRRFLDRHGPGPHHLTFDVPDFDGLLATLAERGIAPASVNREQSGWHEAFLLPADACGVVVQLTFVDESVPPVEYTDQSLAPPATPAASPARLDHVALAVADLDAPRQLFEQILEGKVVDAGDDVLGCWTELAWPGPGRVRFIEPRGSAREWLGDRPGRIHHLAFTVDDPRSVAGSAERDDGSYEVRPEDNLGVRLILRGG